MKLETGALASITEKAFACVPIREIGRQLGFTDEEWTTLLLDPEVQLAIAKGRAQAQLRVNSALMECARNGNAESARLMLQLAFGWPRPKRGRLP